MDIRFSKELLAYKKERNLSTLTVDTVNTRGSCCKVTVSKVSIGAPKSKTKVYTLYTAHNVDIYIDEKLKLEDVITFSYSKFLFKELIEMHGYLIERSSSIF